MRKTTVTVKNLIIDKNMLEAINRVFKGIERSEEYQTKYTYETKKNMEFSTYDFDEFITECSAEKNIGSIDFSLFDYLETGSDRYFKVKIESSSAMFGSSSYYYAACNDRTISDSFLKQIEDRIENCDKYNLFIRSFLSSYFTSTLVILTSYTFSYIMNRSSISDGFRIFLIVLLLLIIVRLVMPFAYPSCDFRLSENFHTKVRKVILWILLTVVASFIGILITRVIKM